LYETDYETVSYNTHSWFDEREKWFGKVSASFHNGDLITSLPLGTW